MRALCALFLALPLAAPALAGAPRPRPHPAPAPGDPAAEPAPDVRVDMSRDTVILTDGTKIVGTIIAAGGRAVMIIEKGAKKERVIRRSEIERFNRGGVGDAERRIVGYKVEVDTEQGVLTLSEQGEGAAPSPSPSKPAPKPKPKPKPKKPPKTANLDRLWAMLGGTASAAQIAKALEKNPGWKQALGRMMRSGKVPPKAQKAIDRLKARMKKDPKFRKELADLLRQGKLPPGAEKNFKGLPGR